MNVAPCSEKLWAQLYNLPMRKNHSIFATLATSLTFIFCSSCAMLFLDDQRTCYKNLKQFTKEHWQRADGDSIIVANQAILQLQGDSTTLASCLIGLSEDQIIQLFGKPHYIDRELKGVALYYVTNARCYPVATSNPCLMYYFRFGLVDGCRSFGSCETLLTR